MKMQVKKVFVKDVSGYWTWHINIWMGNEFFARTSLDSPTKYPTKKLAKENMEFVIKSISSKIS